MPSKLRIIVSGLAALQPVGGMAWHYFQYVIGLARLGHDVYYHEDTWTWPFDPEKNQNSEYGDYSARFISSFFDRYAPNLREHWHYLHLHENSFGMSRKKFEEVACSADLFLNISGANFIPESLSGNCVKVFVDTDPGYNQVMLSEKFKWSENVERWCEIVASHDVHFTFGENLNAEDTLVPKAGLNWVPTRMPIVLDLWPYVSGPTKYSDWTTVMSWNVFKGPVIYDRIEYGDKRVEFHKILSLPKLTGVSVNLALGGGKAPTSLLTENHWNIVDAPTVTRSAEDYMRFITTSRAEISIAKNIYVAMRTGWFSDRSACYLASGKPVVLQDTGFGKYLPVGRGLIAFDTLEGAVEAVQAIEHEYDRHSKAAREVALQYFDSNRVLREMLSSI